MPLPVPLPGPSRHMKAAGHPDRMPVPPPVPPSKWLRRAAPPYPSARAPRHSMIIPSGASTKDGRTREIGICARLTRPAAAQITNGQNTSLESSHGAADCGTSAVRIPCSTVPWSSISISPDNRAIRSRRTKDEKLSFTMSVTSLQPIPGGNGSEQSGTHGRFHASRQPILFKNGLRPRQRTWREWPLPPCSHHPRRAAQTPGSQKC